MNLPTILETAISSLRTSFFGTFSTKKRNNLWLPCSTVILVRLSSETLEYLILGDSYLLLELKTSVEVLVDDRLMDVGSDLRNTLMELMAADGENESPDFRRVQKQLARKELEMRNTPGGYWIASERPEAAHHAVVGERRLVGGRVCILAMTDGFAAACTTFHLYDSWEVLLKTVVSKGLSEPLRQIRRCEEADPFGRTYPRPSRSDDAGVLLLQVEG